MKWLVYMKWEHPQAFRGESERAEVVEAESREDAIKKGVNRQSVLALKHGVRLNAVECPKPLGEGWMLAKYNGEPMFDDHTPTGAKLIISPVEATQA